MLASRLLSPCTLKTQMYNNKMLTYGLHNNLKPLASKASNRQLKNFCGHIKTHDSESRGQEEAQQRDH